MRIMTIVARHQPFTNGVMGGTLDRGADILVTGRA